MSRTSIKQAMDRIKTAPRDSMIAVFHDKKNLEGYVDTVFDSTVQTCNMIEDRHPDYIGSFNRDLCQDMVAATIKSAIEARSVARG
jgi:hypothetical protein